MSVFTRVTLGILLSLVLLSFPLSAATRTWSGNVSSLWSDPANWDGHVPVSGDDLVFPVLGAQWNPVSTNDLASGTAFHSISVLNLGYRISGNAILLGAGGLHAAGHLITISILFSELKFSSITLTESQTWSGSGWGSARVSIGPVNLNGKTLTFTDGDKFGFDPASGTGSIIHDSPLGSTSMASSTYTGPLTVTAGALAFSGVAGDIRVRGSGIGGDDQSNLNSTTLNLSGATIHSLAIYGSGALSIDLRAPTAASGSLTFVPATGDPAWFVTNAYSAGSGPPVAFSAGGTVTLGNAFLVVRSSVSSQFTLVNNQGPDPVSGTFLGLPEGAIVNRGLSLKISYRGGDGNDVTLTALNTVVPGTTTSVRSSSPVLLTQQPITFTATVTSSGGTPGGQMNFYDGGILLGTSSLNSAGVSSWTASFGAGPHLITAAYLGSDAFATSQSSVRLCEAPVLTQQPASQAVVRDQPVTLIVDATGTSPTFQWYEGFTGDTSRPLSGEIDRRLIARPQAGTAFWVKVSNDCGVAQSQTAKITVESPRRRSARH
ncbi:MAG: Ig-like domain-containing protein [Acidobacteriota bacterium]